MNFSPNNSMYWVILLFQLQIGRDIDKGHSLICEWRRIKWSCLIWNPHSWACFRTASQLIVVSEKLKSCESWFAFFFFFNVIFHIPYQVSSDLIYFHITSVQFLSLESISHLFHEFSSTPSKNGFFFIQLQWQNEVRFSSVKYDLLLQRQFVPFVWGNAVLNSGRLDSLYH